MTSADTDAVLAVESAYDAAWNAGDVAGLVRCFAADAVLVTPRGEVAVGAQEIGDRLGAFLRGAARGSRHSTRATRVSFVTADVAVVDGEARVEGGALPRTIEHRFTDLLVRRDSRWLIAHVRAYGRDEGDQGGAGETMERAVPILPADDLRVATDFYAGKLGFRILFEASDDGRHGLLGLVRGTIRITLDCPMDGHGRNACVALEVDDADACFEEWSQREDVLRPPRDEPWGARTFDFLDPFGNTIFVIGPTR